VKGDDVDHSTLEGLKIDRAERPEPAPRRGWWIAGAVLALAAAAGWMLLGGRAPEVRVAPAIESSGSAAAGAVLNASGYVTARRQATVSAKTTGKVVEVLVEEGMKVEEGQILARLDDSLTSRQESLARAEATAARQALAETEVRLAEAELNARRAADLRGQGVSSQADLDAANANADSLRARLRAQREQVEVAARQVELARQAQEDTVIRAPFAGVAISKDAQPGEMVSPISAGGGFTRTGISTIVDMSSLEIEVDVNEAYIARVRSGQRVTATLDAYPEWQIPAHVITPIPSADRQKATVRVRIGFEQLDARILPDMGVKVAFLADADGAAAGEARRLVSVPRAALRQEGGQDVVFVVKDGRLERRAVKVAAAPGDPAQVEAGLAAGESVVVAGPAELEDGAKVRIAPTP
jgi:RND family efflux transporter MFP subunit